MSAADGPALTTSDGTTSDGTTETPRPRPRRRIRRRILLAASGAALLGGAGYGTNFALVYSDRKQNTAGRVDFRNRLRVPDLLDPKPTRAGTRHYALRLAPGRAALLPGAKTPVWGVNGSTPAPTIRMRRDDAVALHVSNRLPQDTTLHWHGMHLPARMDGGPHQMVAKGTTWRPTWTVHQPASTLWYHPHPHGRTADHVYRGVAGLIIVDDEHSAKAQLPSRYGVDDIPVIIQDRNFHSDNTLDLSSTTWRTDLAGIDDMGILGDTVLINGSNVRVYRLGFTDRRRFHLVATENGLLRRPVRLERLRLAPGERAEIVAEFEPGERTVLRSYPPDLGIDFPDSRFFGGEDTFDLLQLRPAAHLQDSPAVPERISGAPSRIAVPDGATVRHFSLVGAQINGRSMDLRRVDAVVPAGATEIWEVERGDTSAHSFHVHGATFEVLSVGGRRPGPELGGPKDTVYLPLTGTVRLAVHFDTLTDSRHPYMYHCHMLRHEDLGMMGQFLVVPPDKAGKTPRRLASTADSGHSGH